jgi:small-conductance mechanosensitive channel
LTQHVASLQDALVNLAQRLFDLLPSLLAALVILFIGWLASWLLSLVARLLSQRFKLDRVIDEAGWTSALRQARIASSPSRLVGRLVFWLTFAVAAILAVDTLDIDSAAVPLGTFLAFLPRVLGAVLLVFAGAVLSTVLSRAVEAGLAGIHFAQHRLAAAICRTLILLITVVAAIEHLGFDVTLLNGLLINSITMIVAAFAITFALGGKDAARNMLAGYYARESFAPGDRVTVARTTGTIRAIGTLVTEIEVEGKGELLVIPNSKLVTSSVRRHDG